MNENLSAESIVEVRGLSKSFNGTEVLRDINLVVGRGENLVVLGKSGSGKSTLIKCIIGLIQPDEGEIFVFGQNIATLNYDQMNQMRLRMGFLFQNGALYDSMSVQDNLEFPLRQHKRSLKRMELDQAVQEALQSVGLPESADRMPAELSGGMSKRIGLARTLILKPEIMLYDEPTTGLDTATSREISGLINDMQRKNKISSVIITHDMTCARLTADRIVMLNEGLLAAEGSFEDLQKDKNEWIQSFFIQ
jgi:phospholipid/cholesterol/gamma-HCH transport system ATP-binding protein